MVQLLPWRWRSLLLSYDCRRSDEDWVGNSAQDFHTWLLSVLKWLITATRPTTASQRRWPAGILWEHSTGQWIHPFITQSDMVLNISRPYHIPLVCVCVAISTSAYARWATEPWRTFNHQKPGVIFRVSEVCKSNPPKHFSVVNKLHTLGMLTFQEAWTIAVI